MWIKANPNPKRKEAPDCVIRAVCIALGVSWYKVHRDLCILSAVECSVPNDDHVWGKYLYELGFTPFILPESCPKCITVSKFCEVFSHGTYIIGTGNHAVTVIDGNYYDSWNSGEQIPSFFWKK